MWSMHICHLETNHIPRHSGDQPWEVSLGKVVKVLGLLDVNLHIQHLGASIGCGLNTVELAEFKGDERG